MFTGRHSAAFPANTSAMKRARVSMIWRMTGRDCEATFDFRNCPLQTGRSGMPWKVGILASISAIRVPTTPTTGHDLTVTNGRYGAFQCGP